LCATKILPKGAAPLFFLPKKLLQIFYAIVEGGTELHLWLADNGNLSVAPEKFEIFIAFEDGRLLKNTIKK